MTRFQLHVAEWKDCRRCELASGRRRVVLSRGQVPCDILFVGEAPGEMENLDGKPFVGPAGHLLDGIIAKAVPVEVRWAIINMVGCFPREAKTTDDHRPPDEAIRACAPRVIDFADFSEPKLIVTVGKTASGWLDRQRKDSVKLKREVPIVELIHPSAILRANSAAQSLLVQRAVVTLSNSVRLAMAGELTIGPIERALKPKARDIKPATRKIRVKAPPPPKKTDATHSTFVGAPPQRCMVCRRPVPRGQELHMLTGGVTCQRPECVIPF